MLRRHLWGSGAIAVLSLLSVGWNGPPPADTGRADARAGSAAVKGRGTDLQAQDSSILDMLRVGRITVVLGETAMDSAVAALGETARAATGPDGVLRACYVVTVAGRETYLSVGTSSHSWPPGRVFSAQHSEWRPAEAACETPLAMRPVEFGLGIALGISKDSVLQVLGDSIATYPGQFRTAREQNAPAPEDMVAFHHEHYLGDEGPYAHMWFFNTILTFYSDGVLVGVIVWVNRSG